MKEKSQFGRPKRASYLSPFVYVTWPGNQITRVSEMIRFAELARVSIDLGRSQVIRDTLEFPKTLDLTLVIAIHLHPFNHVTI